MSDKIKPSEVSQVLVNQLTSLMRLVPYFK